MIAAGLVGAYIKVQDISSLWPLAFIASIPAICSLFLTYYMRQEWAQLIVMVLWAALSVVACSSLGLIPMALMFLTVPAIAMLFFKEKVVEAFILSAFIVAILYYVGQKGYIPESPLSDMQLLWGRQAGLMGTIALLIGAMFMAAQSRSTATSAPDKSSRFLWQEGIRGGVFEFDQDGNLLRTNRRGLKLFKIDEIESPVTTTNLLGDMQEAQKQFHHALKAMRRQNQTQSVRLILPTSEDNVLGQVAHYDVFLSPLKSKGFTMHAIDRTDDEARIEMLRRSQNSAQQDNEDKTLFFAGVSHELRTPLNAIIGFSDMMRSRLFGPLPNKYAEYADLIHDSGRHMLDLIGDVLDMSKVEAGKYELDYADFDFADVVRSSVKMIRPAADNAEVMLDVKLPHDVILVQADRRALRQILLNLLSNAVKFSQKGGQVVISANTDEHDLVICVEDNGTGMSAEDIAQIGMPYAQGTQGKMTSERGTGLGLALVKSLSQLHGGNVDIHSTLGQGTTVTVTIPKAAII